MPKPVSSGQKYMPGLDGLRAVAVLAVIAFHEQFSWAQGGLLGVGVFFTLSGFLITSLLIGQWSAEGRIGLADFWLKRARRLLPALFVMLAVVTAWVTIADRARLDSLRGAVGAAAGYFSNWYLIAKNQSYFARFAPPAPLDHLWSLAVEEQFYLLWPLLLLAGLLLLRRSGARAAKWLAVPTLVLAAASAIAMSHLYQPGMDPTRVYEGTDTRAFGLLIGAALALLWPNAGRRGTLRAVSSPRAREAAEVQNAEHALTAQQAPGTPQGGNAHLPDGAGLDAASTPRPVPSANGMTSLRAPASLRASSALHANGVTRGSSGVVGGAGPGRPGGNVSAIGSRRIGAGAAITGAGRTRSGSRTAHRRRGPGKAGRVLLDAAGFLGLAGIGVMIWRIGEYSAFAYRGGLVVLSLATVAVVAAAVFPGTVVGVMLGWGPLRWIGARSYGIYLWHYPAIVLTSPANSGPDLLRAAWQVAVTVVLAALSWRFVEEPIRHGAIGRAVRRVRSAGWKAPSLRRIRPAGLAGATVAAGVFVVACAGLSGAVRAPSGPGGGSVVSAGAVRHQVTRSLAGARPGKNGHVPAGSAVGASHSPAPGTPGGGPLETSCRAVAHLGDSTSDGLVSAAYLPKPGERITARYEDVGVRTVVTDISGARSVVEVLPGQVNGYDAARAIVRNGFHGCWVIALGTNDTADVAAGSTYSLRYRIARMMKATAGDPVMWVNVKSLLVSGPYAETNMLKWDRALVQACSMYPNMRIFDWASVVQRKWFISDGIHYTSLGYKHRAEMIADALANAFPASGHSNGCVVSS